MNKYQLEYVIEQDGSPLRAGYPWSLGYYMKDVTTGEAVTNVRHIEAFASKEAALGFLHDITDPKK